VLAAAIAEADAVQQQRVMAHLRHCPACARLFAQYQQVQHVLTCLQATREFDRPLQRAMDNLQRRRSAAAGRLVYQRVASAVGELYIARSSQGVSLVAWPPQASRLLSTRAHHEDSTSLHPLAAELAEYVAGHHTQLDWPIDDAFMTSAFQRQVLHLTATIPYGAVMSYQSLAAALGRPQAVRAVAQALRRNPLAIVIPCHRVVGHTGHLTGYAGGLDTKRALLAQEGIPLVTRRHGVFIDRTRMFVGWRSSHYYCRPECPALAELAAGETLLLSARAVAAQPDFLPCEVCHPETVTV
jgi:methylated-DNA-[protein]-cysteine S-methyltransferase